MNNSSECHVDEWGTEKWFYNGQLHREDGPAVVMLSGARWWFYNGQLHREDGPAVEFPNGYIRWYHHGKIHRADGPAVIRSDGRKIWYWDGEECDPLVVLVNQHIQNLHLLEDNCIM